MTDKILETLNAWQADGPCGHVPELLHDNRTVRSTVCASCRKERNEIAPRSIEALREAVAGLGHISRSRTSDGEQLASHRYAGEILKRIESILAGGAG